MSKKSKFSGIGYVLPALFIIAFAMLGPLIYTIIQSLYKSTLYTPTWQFTGFSQYASLIMEDEFRQSIGHTLIWTVGSVTFQFLVGFAAAMFIHQKFLKGRTGLRILLMVPWVLPSIIGAIVWQWMYNSDFGIINYFLQSIGLVNSSVAWLSDPKVAMNAAIIVNVWKMFPYVMLMIEASLQTVPESIKEAAQIDGARPIRVFFTVTLPHIWGTCTTLILLLVIWTLNAFTFIFVLTGGGPNNATQTLPMYIQKMSFQNYDFGRASAAGTILFIITAFVSIVYMKLVSRDGDKS